MTAAADRDILQALLEGARDRLRSLGPGDAAEALLVIHNLREVALASGLTQVAPILDAVANELALGTPGAVERAVRRLQDDLDPFLSCADDEADELQQCFAEEAAGHLAAMRRALRALEQGPASRAPIEELCRLVHTLKGAASMMGRQETAAAAHLIEELLGEVSLGRRALDEPLVRRVRLAVDLLDRLIGRPDQAKDVEIALLTLLGDPQGPSRDSQPPPAERRRGLDRRRDTSTFLRLPLAGLGQLERLLGAARAAAAAARAGLRACDGTAAELEALSSAALDRAEADADPARARQAAREATRLVGGAAELSRAGAELERELRRLEREAGRTGALLGELRSTHAAWIFDRLAPAAEELGQRVGRQLTIERVGDDVPVERHLATWALEQMAQLLRNAVAHGLEEQAQRIALGKAPSGRITLEARTAIGWLHLVVADDGRGIDVEAVRRRVVEMGLRTADEARLASDEEATDWIFLPGVSTRASADQVAGRGVGLDAVRAEAVRHGGFVTVSTLPGQGTRFELHVPDTGEPCRVVLVTVSGTTLALPLADVREQGALGPAVPLASVLGLPPQPAGEAEPRVVAIEGARLAVSSIDGVAEVTIHTLHDRLGAIGPYLGVGQRLDGGGLVLLLDPRRLRSSPEPGRERARAPGPPAESARVLLVEDSPTVRRLLARALAAAGFAVEEAANGLEAWARLGLGGTCPDVLVTDLEMPHIDGFELVRRVRATAALAALPIVVVTSKDTGERRRSLASLGVLAVVAKRSGEAELIGAVREAARAGAARRDGNPGGPAHDN